MAELRWGLTLPFAGVPLAAREPLVRARRSRRLRRPVDGRDERKLALERVPVDLVREILIFGDPAMKERLGELVARGITTPVLTPIGADLIDELAP